MLFRSVDADIDVFDPMDVEWAVATRVQADEDVLIISGARSKPLDPSLTIVPGKIPTTAKMGIDATISDHIPRERYERIAYAYADEVRLEDFVGKDGDKLPPDVFSDLEIVELAGKIREMISAEPLYYADLVERFESEGFQAVGRALGSLHEQGLLWQDKVGKFCMKIGRAHV